MPRITSRPTLVRGRVARVTKLDNCARPVYGEYSQAVTEGVVSAAFTANTAETEAIETTGMSGRRLVWEPSITEFAGYALVLTFARVEFDVFEIITGMPLVFNEAGAVVGIEADTKIKLSDWGFGLEIFAGATGTDVCDDPDAEGEFGYLLLPRMQGGILGDFTIENASISFTITGAQTRDGNRWGRGPYAVERNAAGVAGPLFQPVSPTAALRMQVTTVAPPAEFLGARPLLDPSIAALTGVVAGAGDTPLEVDLTVTPAATGPVYWEFGDGTWDFVVAPGATSHTYAEAGIYTVRATQNGVAVATTEVEVPFP